MLILLTSAVRFSGVPQSSETSPVTGYILLAHLLSTLTSRHPRPFGLLPSTLFQGVIQGGLRRELLMALAGDITLFLPLPG